MLEGDSWKKLPEEDKVGRSLHKLSFHFKHSIVHNLLGTVAY